MRNCPLWTWLFGPRLELSPPEAGELKELPPCETIVSEPTVPPINAGAEFRPYSPTAEGPHDTAIQPQEGLILSPAEDLSQPSFPPELEVEAEFADAVPLILPELAGETLPPPSIPVLSSPRPTYPESWIRQRARYFSSGRYALAAVESFLAPD